MRTIRLTQEIRDDIIKDVRYNWHEHNPEPDLSDVSYKLAKRVLHESYANAFDSVFELLSKDPIRGKFINLQRSICVQVRETGQQLNLEWDTPLPVPNIMSMPSYLLVSQDYDEYRNFDVLYRQYHDWKNAQTTLDYQLNLVVHTVDTVSELTEGWPELKPYINQFMQNPTLFQETS